jgi:hypothetical protein
MPSTQEEPLQIKSIHPTHRTGGVALLVMGATAILNKIERFYLIDLFL